MQRVPTFLDRYPAKMVSRLADVLVERYASDCVHLLDPFCGSGAVLKSARDSGYSVTGIDINPYATLLTRVKLDGFDGEAAESCCFKFVELARSARYPMALSWMDAPYWFTRGTLSKYERLRFAGAALRLDRSRAGRAVLLAFALSVRLCSRADQRSPKPFISQQARTKRAGKHFDPYREIPRIVRLLTTLYSEVPHRRARVKCLDVVKVPHLVRIVGDCSHIITSPPYINAQDYFRNFKLELYLLEGMLPVRVGEIARRFIGTERGLSLEPFPQERLEYHRGLLSCLRRMERTHPRQAAVVHRYLADMTDGLKAASSCLKAGGTMVLVCGDNLVGGYRVCTWAVLNAIVTSLGFELFDTFGDIIDRRMLAPRRLGHKGLIKVEVVSAFRKADVREHADARVVAGR